MPYNPSEADAAEEEKSFAKVVNTFQNYRQYSLAANYRRRKDIYTLPKVDQELLSRLGYKQKLDEVDKAIEANAKFLSLIVKDANLFGGNEDDGTIEGDESCAPGPTQSHGEGSSHSHDHSHSHADSGGHGHTHSHSSRGSHGSHGPKPNKPSELDMDKLRSTLKQFVRDWSEEGKEEREKSYKPLKDALVEHFSSVPEDKRRELRVLVPGAGLGRLAYDVVRLGFSCQGNEFSHYMLLASHFILNRTDKIKEHILYPYVHSFSNAPNKQSILQAIAIPDVLPSDLPSGSNFSLVAGDFEEVYGTESDPDEPQYGKWNAILTCFFIDTAKNIVNYLRIIHDILEPGGVWINLGPLLWHWENNQSNDPSIEIDLEEVKQLAHEIGFEISNERTIDATYTNNAQSMLGYTYSCQFWTATKISPG